MHWNLLKFMLLPLIYFLPCIVSLLWFFSFLLKKKNYKQRIFCYAQGFSFIFYAIFGIYLFPDVDYSTMVKMETVCIPLGMLYPALFIAVLYSYYTSHKMSERKLFLLIIPAIIIGVAVNLLCFIIGFDKASEVSRQFASPEGLTGAYNSSLNRLYCFFTYNAFVAMEAIYLVLITITSIAIEHKHGYRIGDVCRFLFKGKETTLPRALAVMALTEILLVIPPMVIGSVYFSHHMVLGASLVIVLAIVKHLTCFLVFYSDDNKPFSLYDISHLTMFSGKANDRSAPEVQNETTGQQPTPALTKMDKRHEQFKNLMEVDQVWKDENLTAATLCEIMNVGKTTLSAMVNQYYEMPLRDIINRYRIEEAKKFMVENPGATQDIIAQHCGFKNAQYFNTQFKKTVGDTPAMWLASRSCLKSTPTD